jgi:hypothetical protein
VLVGACLGIGELQPNLPQFGLQGRDLLLQQGDLAFLKGEITLGQRRERSTNLGGQTRLLVHADDSITGSLRGLPHVNDYRCAMYPFDGSER